MPLEGTQELGAVKPEKVMISAAPTYEELDEAEPVELLFNPAEYSLDKDQQIGEVGIPGLDSPVLQYVHGGARTLSMELFIDTTEPAADPRHPNAAGYVAEITDLMLPRSDTHAPPICRVAWHDLTFTGVLASARASYLLFTYQGAPLRATVDVTFREYRPIKVQLKEPRRDSPDRTKVRILKEGETLAGIAHAEYEDAGRWRVIAAHNHIDDPRRVPPGSRLIIPPLPEAVEGRSLR